MDKRKYNGGNSTKSKGIDKRKNEYKQALQIAGNIDDVVKVIQTVKKEAIGGDLQACKLYLEYYLGKPKDTVENINYTVEDKELTDKAIKRINEVLDDTY